MGDQWTLIYPGHWVVARESKGLGFITKRCDVATCPVPFLLTLTKQLPELTPTGIQL